MAEHLHDGLESTLEDWTDLEDAAFHVARFLSILPSDARYVDWKWMFWSVNPIGDAVYQIMSSLVAIGAIEQDPDDETIVRWNPSFDAAPKSAGG